MYSNSMLFFSIFNFFCNYSTMEVEATGGTVVLTLQDLKLPIISSRSMSDQLMTSPLISSTDLTPLLCYLSQSLALSTFVSQGKYKIYNTKLLYSLPENWSVQIC